MFIRQPRPDCWKQASRATQAHRLRGRLVLDQPPDLALQHLAARSLSRRKINVV